MKEILKVMKEVEAAAKQKYKRELWHLRYIVYSDGSGYFEHDGDWMGDADTPEQAMKTLEKLLAELT